MKNFWQCKGKTHRYIISDLCYKSLYEYVRNSVKCPFCGAKLSTFKFIKDDSPKNKSK